MTSGMWCDPYAGRWRLEVVSPIISGQGILACAGQRSWFMMASLCATREVAMCFAQQNVAAGFIASVQCVHDQPEPEGAKRIRGTRIDTCDVRIGMGRKVVRVGIKLHEP